MAETTHHQQVGNTLPGVFKDGLAGAVAAAFDFHHLGLAAMPRQVAGDVRPGRFAITQGRGLRVDHQHVHAGIARQPGQGVVHGAAGLAARLPGDHHAPRRHHQFDAVGHQQNRPARMHQQGVEAGAETRAGRVGRRPAEHAQVGVAGVQRGHFLGPGQG